MSEAPPLSTLLSQVLVAFTIEFDNEAEHRMAHRTTRHGRKGRSPGAPWLVSLVMWSNCMQFVSEEGITAGELVRRARTKTNLAGMHRWGYISVEPPAPNRPSKKPNADWLVRVTPAGRQAQEVWRALPALVEKRWSARFGEETIANLRRSLWSVAGQLDVDLPDGLPILGYGLSSKDREGYPKLVRAEPTGARPELALPALLSRVLLKFTLEFESQSPLSLAISANILPALSAKGVPVRNLPRLTGVSKEAVAMATGFLRKRRLAVVKRDSRGHRRPVARLTAAGERAQKACPKLLRAVEERWRRGFGGNNIASLRKVLESLAGDGTAAASPLFRGLQPYADGWRASLAKPRILPHHPMVLHRGGFPDGS